MYDLKDPSTLAQIIQIVESQENESRIDKHFDDYQIIHGNQKAYVENELRKRYPETWDTMSIIYLAVGRKIMRKLSRCYANGSNREVVDAKTGQKNEELTALFNVVYSDTDDSGISFNAMMNRANQHYTIHRYVEIFTYLDEENKIRFKSLPQHLFTAMPNQSKTKAEVLIFKQSKADFINVEQFIDWNNYDFTKEDSEVVAIYTVWSKESNFTFVNLRTVKKIDNEEVIVFTPAIVVNEKNMGNKNPIDCMPFVPLKEETDGHFYPYGTEIAEMSMESNVIFSDIISIAAQQGFGQAVIYYDGEKPPAITKTGPTNVLNIPNRDGKSKFEFANANPDLKGHLDIALSLVRILLTTNDLTTDKVSGELSATNFSSAIDRLIADSETVENIEDQRKKYITAEQTEFKIVMKYLQYLHDTNLWPDEYPKVSRDLLDETKYKIKIFFNTVKQLTTEKDKAETIVYLEENGFIKPYEKHLRFNESMTEDEAKVREGEIVELRKKLTENKLNSMIQREDIIKDEVKDADQE